MKRRNLGRNVLALVIACALVAGIVTLFNEPANAYVFDVECPNVPTCSSTQYLRVYGGCADEFESCVLYRYAWASNPHCKVCN